MDLQGPSGSYCGKKKVDGDLRIQTSRRIPRLSSGDVIRARRGAVDPGELFPVATQDRMGKPLFSGWFGNMRLGLKGGFM